MEPVFHKVKTEKPDDNGGQGSSEGGGQVFNQRHPDHIPDDGPHHRSGHEKGGHDKEENADPAIGLDLVGERHGLSEGERAAVRGE